MGCVNPCGQEAFATYRWLQAFCTRAMGTPPTLIGMTVFTIHVDQDILISDLRACGQLCIQPGEDTNRTSGSQSIPYQKHPCWPNIKFLEHTVNRTSARTSCSGSSESFLMPAKMRIPAFCIHGRCRKRPRDRERERERDRQTEKALV